MSAQRLASFLMVVALGVAVDAHAQTAPPTASEVTSAALPLELELELGRSKLHAESVRKAIEIELKRPVLLSSTLAAGPGLTVVAHPDHTVTVSYRSSTGSIRTRSIGVPEDSARGAEVIALLAGNLTRDEAAELLAEMAASSDAPRGPATISVDASETANNQATTNPIEPAQPSVVAPRPPPSPVHARISNPTPLLKTPFPALDLSLISPLTLYRQSARRVFSGELGLGYSHVGELHGAGLNALVLRTERDVRGASFATLYNDTGGTVTGFNGSALINRRQALRGVELSGLLNLGSADAQGFAAAGLANVALSFEGFQAAGLLNWAGNFKGLQAAGGINRAGSFSGVQAAGAVNIAGSLSGLQLGVVNVAGDVHGLQLGVVNVAKQVKGTSIGLVSVADNGRIQPVLWTSSSLPLNAAAKFTVGPIYTQAGLGYAPGNQTYVYELGVGGHFPIGRFFLEPGLHYSEMRSAKQPFDHELIEYAHYRFAAGLDLGRVSPFAGLGILQRFAHSSDAPPSVPVTLEAFAGAAFF